MKTEYTITFTVRPFVWLRRMTYACVALVPMLVPLKMSSTTPEKDAAVEALVEQVEAEVAPRIRGVTSGEAEKTARAIVHESAKYNFDPLWVVAVIEAESNFDAEVCSPTGARGLMQLLPRTFRSVSKASKMYDPVENVRAGIAYLGFLSKTFHRAESILMAYNGGPAAATAYLKAQASKEDLDGHPAEMRGYPSKVTDRYKKLLVRAGKDPRRAHLSYHNLPDPVKPAKPVKRGVKNPVIGFALTDLAPAPLLTAVPYRAYQPPPANIVEWVETMLWP